MTDVPGCGHECCDMHDSPGHAHAVEPESCDGCAGLRQAKNGIAKLAGVDDRFDHLGAWPPEISERNDE